MKKSKFADTQIISVLQEVESGMKVEKICQKHGINSATITNGSLSSAAWMLRISSEYVSLKKRMPS